MRKKKSGSGGDRLSCEQGHCRERLSGGSRSFPSPLPLISLRQKQKTMAWRQAANTLKQDGKRREGGEREKNHFRYRGKK
jgi:hypothetical protein